ncbi:hypothetical protein Asppvi_004518 [Aspergillus pseudoviridinutans]|uniref:Uncharacterized protein n=1 Tax=Aspergillus pseudoviridinutans TaxID=1517512 RepID=A0A9P3ETG3_9EURO|nr:uncharacterized protein Asppvi_004518 [Aspergillus pseudoviridinutans]GIJ85657.1 hypothetical protein Asppvi_004518 [Aspergillus pseudoviridinutans]
MASPTEPIEDEFDPELLTAIPDNSKTTIPEGRATQNEPELSYVRTQKVQANRAVPPASEEPKLSKLGHQALLNKGMGAVPIGTFKPDHITDPHQAAKGRQAMKFALQPLVGHSEEGTLAGRRELVVRKFIGRRPLVILMALEPTYVKFEKWQLVPPNAPRPVTRAYIDQQGRYNTALLAHSLTPSWNSDVPMSSAIVQLDLPELPSLLRTPWSYAEQFKISSKSYTLV